MTTQPLFISLCTTGILLLGLSHTNTAWSQSAPAAKTKPAASKPEPKVTPPQKLPTASTEQLAAAGIAHLGDYACELGDSVHVQATPKNEGYIDVHHKKAVYTMTPVLSSTGALRLEDVHGRMFYLQIANKSMLMDQKAGQRVVDGCVHEKQRAAAAAPPTQSLGIAPEPAPAPAPAPASVPAPASASASGPAPAASSSN